MDISDLRLLLDFHYWARDRVLDAVAALDPEAYGRDLGSSFPSIRATLTHTYSAEWAWCQRWHGTSPTAMLSPELFPDVAALRMAWTELETKMRSFVEELGPSGINRVFEYRFLSGQPGSSIFWQNLQHVVNHASYHRGQVTTMLRQLGMPPPKSMDVIIFYRERSAAGA